MANNEQGDPPGEQGGSWRLTEGNPSPQEERYETYRSDGTENLTYTNPYGSEVERVWFDGKMVYALDCGDIDLDFDENRAARQKVAQEYQIVYAVELDEQGKFAGGREPEYVEGQYNIYDSVPGMEKYSPLWQFNYVVVGRHYEPNTLRSEADCRERLPDREEHGRRELTRTVSAAVRGARRVKDESLSEGDQTWLT